MSTSTWHGLELPDLGDDALVEGALVVVKYLTAKGSTAYREQVIGITTMEGLGMAISVSDSLRAQLMGGDDD